jgi:hypothetical protein
MFLDQRIGLSGEERYNVATVPARVGDTKPNRLTGTA